MNNADGVYRYYTEVLSNLFYTQERIHEKYDESIYGVCHGTSISKEGEQSNAACTLQNHINTQQLLGKACFIQYRAALDSCKRPTYKSDLSCFPIMMNIDEYETGNIDLGRESAEW